MRIEFLAGCPTLSPGVGEGWEQISAVPVGLGFLFMLTHSGSGGLSSFAPGALELHQVRALPLDDNLGNRGGFNWLPVESRDAGRLSLAQRSALGWQVL